MSESQPTGFLADLRRRGVVRVLAVYLAAAWVAVEVSETTFPRLGLPDWLVTAVVWAAVLLFPIVAGVAWLFQVEDGRVRRDLRSAPRRARAVVAVVGGLTVLVAVAAWWGWLRPTSVNEPERPGTVAVLPFRTTGADPALGYLREGLVDMLYLTLTGEVGPRAIPPRTVFSAWRRLAGSVETELSRDSAMAAARATGADAVIMGAVVGSTNHLTISASLMDARDTGEAKSARVSGPPDSLPRLVEQLTGVLLSLESGQNPLDLAPLAETPLPALRAYLQGAKAYRRAEFDKAVDHFRAALEIDSTFASAAFGMELAAPWAVRTDVRERGRAIAWRHRDRLSSLDRLHLAGRSGPAYPEHPTVEELLEVRERAVEAMPDRAEVWYELGDLYFHWGRVLGEDDWKRLARDGFYRALEADAQYGPPIHHLMMLAAMRGDAAAVGNLRSRLGGTSATFGRWLEAHLVGDTADLRRVRSALDTAPPVLLIAILGSASQTLGLDPADAHAAVNVLAGLPVAPTLKRTYLLTARAVELQAGHPAAALRWLDAYAEIANEPDHESRLAITDALYAGGDSARAETAARHLERASGPDGSTGLENRCLAAQWRLWNGHGLTDKTLPERARAAAGEAWGRQKSQLAVCAGIVDALATPPGPGRDRALDRLDTLLLRGPYSGLVSMGGPYYGNLALSRLREEAGDLHRALAASRRWPYFHGQPPYTAEFRLQEARLAERLGLDSAAVTAYRHFVDLQADPEPVRHARVDSARARLTALLGALDTIRSNAPADGT